jgi:homoserine O-succinyltransferase/O-acetyltransferase
MTREEKMPVRVAVLDLYEGFANQGMRCIRDLAKRFAQDHNLALTLDEYDVRLKNEVPDTSYDIYISSGGPGSPLESEGSLWESYYFRWLKNIEDFNADESNPVKKQVFFICHSFQLICRHYGVANVSKRRSTSFGVFPVHANKQGKDEPVFAGLKEPFYAVDSRDYQVTGPNKPVLRKMGAQVLAIEKERPHVDLERAIMAIRFNRNFIGTQFHPEADAAGMRMYLQTDERKKTVVENHGYAKWESMVEQLADPDKIEYTQHHILPNFLSQAVKQMQVVEAWCVGRS